MTDLSKDFFCSRSDRGHFACCLLAVFGPTSPLFQAQQLVVIERSRVNLFTGRFCNNKRTAAAFPPACEVYVAMMPSLYKKIIRTDSIEKMTCNTWY